MAAKWWRYNSTSHIFEQSLNEGDTWTVPPLNASIITEGVFDAARLPSQANVAYTNVANNFTARQLITGKINDTYGGAPLEIQTAGPKLAFHWPGVVASQIGMDTSGRIRTYDNPGTSYEKFMCKDIQTSDDKWISNILTTGYMYPAAVTNPGVAQGSWYLSAHSSYGLYTGTGLYVASAVWTGDYMAPGQGVIFPAAQVNRAEANALDDYEEGVWTPVLAWSGGGANGTPSNAAGYYTKIGRLVHLTGLLTLSNKGGGLGQAYIAGIPFSPANATNIYSAQPHMVETGIINQYGYGPVGRIHPGSAAIWQYYTLGHNAAGLPTAALGNTTQWSFNATYVV